MSGNDTKGIVLKYIDQVWNNADLAALNELTGPDFTYIFGGQPPRDKNTMQQFLQAVHGAFPDWRVQVEDIVVEGSTAAARWSGRVTHMGVFQGIPPSGKQVYVSGINFYLIEDGRIIKEWEQMDSLGLLHQLGAIPSPK